MINVAIVDDCQTDIETLKKALLTLQNDFSVEFNIFQFQSGTSLLLNYESKYDLIFLDIELVNENGIQIARDLRKIDKTVIIIFVTNVAKYAAEGYEVDALDFIVKPVNKSALKLKMSRIISRLHKTKSDTIIIKSIQDEVIKLSIERIMYVEVDDHYVIFHTTDGIFKEYQSLKQIKNQLPEKTFVYCNRGTLVNLSYVKSIKKDMCLINDESIPISRPQKNNFINAYVEFLGGE